MDKNEATFTVYLHKLKQDGRVYVGQTNSSMKERAGSSGHKYKGCPKFWHAIQKYGWDAFEHILVKDKLTIDEANKLEDDLILKYNSIENGFNINRGGRNHTWTDEQRKTMSERNIGEKNPNYGKPRSEETKKRIGAANAISQLGKHHSEEVKKKMSMAHRKKEPILCVETGKIYNDAVEAAEAIGKKASAANHIREVCTGKRLSAYSYTWKYLDKDKGEIINNES